MESSGYYVIDHDYNLVQVNETARKTYPQLKLGQKCYACLMNLDAPCGPCPVANGVVGPRTYTDPIRNMVETVEALEVTLPGGKPGHALVFGTVGERAEYAATLPPNIDDLKFLSLVQALTNDYRDVFMIRVADGMTTTFRHNNQWIAEGSTSARTRDYDETNEEFIGRFVHPDDREMVKSKSNFAFVRQWLQANETLVVHYRVVIRGKPHYYYHKFARLGPADVFERIIVGVGCEDDQVELHLQKQDLQNRLNLVACDPLTGLYNKEAFLLRGERLLKSNPQTAYDLCVFKVDNLGMINHQYGNAAGDRLLNLIGSLLQAYETDNNCIAYARNGNFVSLTENKGDKARQDDIMVFRQNILDGSEMKNLSLKWSIYKNIDRSMPLTDVYEKTDYALSTIRASIHEDYVEFDQEMFRRLERETELEKRFEEALENHRFICHYQPKYRVKDRQLVGAEALVRWVEEDGSLISPAEFIPILEKTGKINRLDAYVFRQVCRLQQTIAAMGCPVIPISVNLSRASMFTENIALQYSLIAQQTGADVSKVPIEITESAAVRAVAIHSFANELIENGFVLHMDDFGAGYSSLASLTVIPFKSIKLDKTLIDCIGHESNENLLKHVIAYAHEEGQSVVAEGVENHEQYLFLKVCGCDSIQGFYFSKPLDEQAFLALLQTT